MNYPIEFSKYRISPMTANLSIVISEVNDGATFAPIIVCADEIKNIEMIQDRDESIDQWPISKVNFQDKTFIFIEDDWCRIYKAVYDLLYKNT